MYITTGHIQLFNHMITTSQTMKISPTFLKTKKINPRHRHQSELLALQFRRSRQTNLQILKTKLQEVDNRILGDIGQEVNHTLPRRNVVRFVQDQVIGPLRSLISSGVQQLQAQFRSLVPQPPTSEILELIDDWKPSAAIAVTTITEEPDCEPPTPEHAVTRTITGYDKEGKYREIHQLLYGPDIPYGLLHLTPPYSPEEETDSDSDDLIDQESLISQSSSPDCSRSDSSHSWIPDFLTTLHEDLDNRPHSARSSDRPSSRESVSSRDSDLEDNPLWSENNPDYDRLNCQCDHWGHRHHRHSSDTVSRVRVRNHFRFLETQRSETYHTDNRVSLIYSTNSASELDQFCPYPQSLGL